MMFLTVTACEDIYDHFISIVGYEKRFMLFYVNGVSLFEDIVPFFSQDMDRSGYGNKDFFMSLSRFNQPVAFMWFQHAVDHVAGVSMEILHSKDILAPLFISQFFDIKCFHSVGSSR